MKRTLFALFIVSLSGCAHQSIHDYCVGEAEHFNSYEECYAETSVNHANNGIGRRALHGFATGLANANKNKVTCHTSTFGSNSSTTCQ